MVDIVVKTRRITREQIAAAVGNNPRLIRLIESLTHDVTVSIPDAVAQVQDQSVFSLWPADSSKAVALGADQTATRVEMIEQTCRRISGELAASRIEVELLRAELADARSRLMSATNTAQSAASDALAILLGA